MLKVKIYNHLEALKPITSKGGLIRALKKYYEESIFAKEYKYTVFDSTPTSFVIDIDNHCNASYLALLKRYQELSQGIFYKEKLPEKHCKHNMWIVKPSFMNQGRGIEICKNLREIKQCIFGTSECNQWVVQKYIEKPLLYKGRKFDIRIWVLVTDKCEVFYYEEGYIRTSSINFTNNNNHNYIHLTNNCLQQFGNTYGKYEDGNTLSFEDLQKYLDLEYADKKVSVNKQIVPRIKDLIIDTILAIQYNEKNMQKHCFELLGYDFMIDEDFRVWLIEVNSNPYLGIPNDYIRDILPSMINEMFSIVLDTLYPCDPPTCPYITTFELIYSPGIKNIRRVYCKDLIYPVKSYQQLTALNRLPREFLYKSNKIPKKLEEHSKSKKVIHMGSHKSPTNIDHKLPFIVPYKKHHIKKNGYSIKQKTRMNVTRHRIKLSLLDKLKIAIDTNDNKKLKKLFHKFAGFVKDCENFEQVEQKEDTIKTLKLFLDFKNLFRTTIENEDDLYDLFEVALNCANYITLEVRHAIADIMLVMSKDRLLKKKLFSTRPLHLLVDFLILEDNEELVKVVERILQNLLEIKNKVPFIPGEKLENERLRIILVQHGVVYVLAHVAGSGKSNENSIMAECILNQFLKFHELKWTLAMLTKYTLHKEPNNELNGDVYGNNIYNIEDDQQYVNLWSNKELILSK